MAEGHENWRIKQDGVAVAQTTGPAKEARRQIAHYAFVYGQDGPVEVEKKIGRKWLPATPPVEDHPQ